MKNYLFGLKFLLVIFLYQSHASAQFRLNLSQATVAPNGTAQIDVTVSGFNNIVIKQYSINWNPNIARFNSVTNLSTILPDFSIAGNFALPGTGAESLPDGQIAVSWNESGTNPVTIPDGTRLFTIVLNAVGSNCSETLVSVTDTPTRTEVYDQNLDRVNVVTTPGRVSIDNGQCNGTGEPGAIGVVAPIITAAPGAQFCIPVSVRNFSDVQSTQFGIVWNPTLISFQGFNNFGQLPAPAVNTERTANGEFRFLWFDNTGANPVNLPNGTEIFELCFQALGSAGTSSNFDFVSIGDFIITFTDSNDEDIAFQNSNGRVNISADGQPTDFTLEIDRVTASEGTETCLNVIARNFNDISSMQYTMQWSPSVINFTRVTDFNLQGLNMASFNPIENNRLRLTWNSFDGSGVNIPNGTSIYKVCYNVVGDCNTQPTSSINFINDGNIQIEIVRGTTQQPITELNLVSGRVEVAPCGINYQLVSITSPECAEDAGGSIIVSLSGGSNDCGCTWENDQGTVISSGTLGGNNCNLLGVRAGTYTLRVTCPDLGQLFTRMETITGPAPIIVNAQVTNAGCASTGRINLNVTGGVGTLSYSWNPDQGNIPNPDELVPGTYAVTVTDGNGCTGSNSFEVSEQIGELTISNANVSNVSCAGEEDGSIVLTIINGCPDMDGNYSIAWADAAGNPLSGGTSLTGLSGGTYNVTITDFGDPVQEVTASYTITEAQPLTITVVSVSPATEGMGAIEISVAGGVSPYIYIWSPNVGTTPVLMGLSDGTYSVTVTDAAGCTQFEDIEVPPGGVSFSNVRGIASPCAGECTGRIAGNIINAAFPVTATITGPTPRTVTISQTGEFSINDLCPGTYTLRFEDANNMDSEVPNLVVDQPQSLVIVAGNDQTTCVDVGGDGAINPIVAGGVTPYQFMWSTGATTPSISNLNPGTYSLIVIDANGCETLAMNIRVRNCSELDGNCYESLRVITPNNDGANDEFVILCAEDYPSRLMVYDRSGVTVYSTNNYQNNWAGTNNQGQLLPEGPYMWVLEVDFGQGQREVYKGTVTLLRDF